MANSMVLKLVAVVLTCMVASAPIAEAAITCGQVTSALMPCLGYLQNGGSPPPNCCAGVRSLNSAAKSTPDRQAACGCLKQAAGSVSGLIPASATSLPGKCGVNIGYPINPNIDCSKVKESESS